MDPFGVMSEYPKFLGNLSSELQEMEAKVSQLSANSARLAVELGTWRKHPSDKEVVTSFVGVFTHVTTGFLASKELRYKNLGKDVEKNEVSPLG